MAKTPEELQAFYRKCIRDSRKRREDLKKIMQKVERIILEEDNRVAENKTKNKIG